jgi:tetratricopeptide (TPR) repeat protein/predicted Ser/Thr protein kinase
VTRDTDEGAQTADELDGLLARVAATDSPAQLAPVPALAGRYEVRARIGRGGLGVVHVAWDPELRREVALKFVRPDRSAGGSGLQLAARLRREARVLARLDDPAIVKVFDVGEEHGRIWIAMERLHGMPLSSWLAQRSSWRTILDAFVRAGRGLAAGHDAGVVHRDFKPDNVFVEHSGRIVVVDFGLAGLTDDSRASVDMLASTPRQPGDPRLTETGAVVGTRGYVAPEQLVGAPPSVASDLFAFCVSLAESLWQYDAVVHGGHAPHLSPPPRAGIGRVPGRLWPIVRRGLATEPGLRPASMRELLAQLEGAARSSRAPFAPVAVAVAVPIALALALANRAAPDDELDTLAPADAVDDSTAQVIQGVRERLAIARAAYSSDAPTLERELARAREELDRLGPRADTGALEAEWSLLSGRHAMHQAEPRAAEQLEAAFFTATEHGEDRLAFDAALQLADLRTWGGELQTSQSWIDRAEALLALQSDPGAQADLWRRKAYLHIREGRAELARAAAEQAVAVRERLGVDSRELSADLYIAAAAHVECNEHARGRALYERALAIDIELLGPDHPNVALVRANLGNLELDEDRPNEALAHFRRALAIDERHFAPDAFRLSLDRANVANALAAAGQPAAAVEMLKAELPAIERHGDDLFLAQAYAVLGDMHDELEAPLPAMAAYQRALAVYEARLDGDNSEMIGEIALSIGEQWTRLGRPERALEYLVRARAMLDAQVGVDLRPARVRIAIARAELVLHHREAARESAQEALESLAGLDRSEALREEALSILAEATR